MVRVYWNVQCILLSKNKSEQNRKEERKKNVQCFVQQPKRVYIKCVIKNQNGIFASLKKQGGTNKIVSVTKLGVSFRFVSLDDSNIYYMEFDIQFIFVNFFCLFFNWDSFEQIEHKKWIYEE